MTRPHRRDRNRDRVANWWPFAADSVEGQELARNGEDLLADLEDECVWNARGVSWQQRPSSGNGSADTIRLALIRRSAGGSALRSAPAEDSRVGVQSLIVSR